MEYNAFNVIIKYKKYRNNQWYIKSLDYKKLIDKIIQDIHTQRYMNKNNTTKTIIIQCNRTYVHKELTRIQIKNKNLNTIKDILYKLPLEMYEEANEILIIQKYGSQRIYKTHIDNNGFEEL